MMKTHKTHGIILPGMKKLKKFLSKNKPAKTGYTIHTDKKLDTGSRNEKICKI